VVFTATANTLRVKIGTGTGPGTTWNNAYGSLQDAIDAAQPGDEIWIAAGTYTPPKKLSDKYTPIYSFPFPDRYNSFYITEMNNIKIYGGFPNTGNPAWTNRDPATYRTILTGAIPQSNGTTLHSYHVVILLDAKDIVLDGLEITGGNANGTGLEYIMNDNSSSYTTYELSDKSGGGIYMADFEVELNNVKVYNNSALSWGGGIYAERGRYYEVLQGTFDIVSVSNGDPSTLVIRNSVIEENEAVRGGGLYSEKILLELTNTIIKENSAIAGNSSAVGDGCGGGLYICNYDGTIYSNYLNTVLVADNTAAVSGGGMYLGGDIRMDMRTSTIAGNTATTTAGQGIYCEQYHNGLLIFRGSILAWNGSNNNSTHGLSVTSTTQTTYYSSLVQGFTTTANNCLSGSTNPLFVNIYGKNYRLQSSSPCIDNGCCSVTSTDLDGNARVYGNGVDMGAYESTTTTPPQNPTIVPDGNGIVYVKKGSTGNGSSWDNATGELADVLLSAATNTSISQIYVAEGTYNPLYAADGSSTDPQDRSFVINRSVYGGFPANSNNSTTFSHRNWQVYPTVLSGYLGQINNQHTYSYHVAIAASHSFSLDGFIIEAGIASGTGSIMVNGYSIARNNGGGLYVESVNGSAILRDVKIHDCQAANYGGGIYEYSTDMILNSVWIMNNHATIGGGIYLDNTLNTNSSKWHYVSLIENHAQFGGGMYNTNLTAIFLNFYICGNSATNKGSALYNDNIVSIDYYNTLIAQNEINGNSNTGGSIFNSMSSPNFHNTTIAMCIPDGIGMINDNSFPYLCNSIIWSDNLLQPGQQAVLDFNSMPTYHHCLIQDMQPAGNNLPHGVNPHFINSIASSTYQSNYGDYHLMQGSQCIDWGDNACMSTSYMFLGDLDNNIPRILGNIDLGCYEFNPGNPNPLNNPYHKSMENKDMPAKENLVSSNLSLSVYPNPISSGQQPMLFLGEDNLYYEHTVDVKVYSLEGKQIYSKTYSSGNITLDIPQLPAGIYVIHVQNQEGKVYNNKLVITQ
jgi:hypothetical protein